MDLSPAALIAIGAAALALIVLVLHLLLALRVRRLRADQQLLLGEEQRRDDLIAHAAGIERSFRELHAYVAETATRLDDRMTSVETWLDDAIIYRAVVHYDAFDEMTGQQSWSLALLDATRSGVVLTQLMRRDQARLYLRRVRAGEGEHPLAPEELEALRLAVAEGGREPVA